MPVQLSFDNDDVKVLLLLLLFLLLLLLLGKKDKGKRVSTSGDFYQS